TLTISFGLRTNSIRFTLSTTPHYIATVNRIEFVRNPKEIVHVGPCRPRRHACAAGSGRVPCLAATGRGRGGCARGGLPVREMGEHGRGGGGGLRAGVRPVPGLDARHRSGERHVGDRRRTACLRRRPGR